MPNSPPSVEKPAAFWKSKGAIVLGMLLVIAAFYVVNEHLEHAGQALPYLILLLCPLMHIFGHHHHGGHNHRGHHRPDADATKDD
jgi:hypothetical protein